jgi:hypothetical protein
VTAGGDVLLPLIARVRNGSSQRQRSADRRARDARVRLLLGEEGLGAAACEARDQRSAVKPGRRLSRRVDRASVTRAIRLPAPGLFARDATRA